MNFLAKRLILAGIMLATALGAMAVSDAEMDQARAIAAKWYLRYVNNGSDYLNPIKPTSMSDLEGRLKDKEKENIKAFKAASYSKDYASWDQAALANYWSSTFFANATGLDTKGNNAGAKKEIKKEITAEVKVAEAQPAQNEAEAVAAAEAEVAATAEQLAAAEEADQLQEAQNIAAEEEAKAKKEEEGGSGTWVYIMILGLLVVAVIFLVIYASRTMKAQPNKEAADEPDDSDEVRFQPAIVPEEPVAEGKRDIASETRMREKYAQTLASKSEEIRSLTRQLGDMEALAASLKEENRRLSAEVERLRNAKYAPQEQPATRRNTAASMHHNAEPEYKEVYLGRVNSRGLFVRADRHAVDGQSIFKLSTSNGVSGTYTVIVNPIIADYALADPGKWLAGGCFAKDLYDTDGKDEIITETPGTAVFRDGAWRVEKKAKIRYS